MKQGDRRVSSCLTQEVSCYGERIDIEHFLRLSDVLGVCPNGWIHMQGSCYKLFSKGLSWNAAKSACEALGSKLVVINSQTENRAVVLKLAGSQGTLIVLHRDPRDKSRWLWVDGSRPTNTYWNSGEPNNYGGYEGCAHAFPKEGGAVWNDLPCASMYPYVCETSGRSENIMLYTFLLRLL